MVTPKMPDGYPDTFAVSIYDEGEECMISALRWHSHAVEPEEAFGVVFGLLTPYCRIVEEFKGGLYVAGWLETYEVGGWAASDPVFFLNPDHAADWQVGPDEHYLLTIHQQAVLAPLRPYSELVPGVDLEPDTGLPVGSELGRSTKSTKESLGRHIA